MEAAKKGFSARGPTSKRGKGVQTETLRKKNFFEGINKYRKLERGVGGG